jgi:hypothetical protein
MVHPLAGFLGRKTKRLDFSRANCALASSPFRRIKLHGHDPSGGRHKKPSIAARANPCFVVLSLYTGPIGLGVGARKEGLMVTKSIQHAFILLVLLGQSFAEAQSDRYEGPSGGFYPPVAPWPPEMFFRYHHASTALEGALRGMAALRHADGSYLMSASQAAILNEQARWLALDNRQRWIEFRIGLRHWREFDRQARVAKKRKANESRRQTRYAVYQLGSDQFDRISGQIYWPRMLRAAEYRLPRQRLNSLFRASAADVISATERRDETDRTIEDLRRALRSARLRFGRKEYDASNCFLNGLDYENEFGTQT